MPPVSSSTVRRSDRFAWTWKGQAVAVEYDTLGDGSGTILLLPAFSTVSSREEMRPLAQQLGAGFRTVTPDWPGFGRGRHPRLDHSPELHLAFLRAFVERTMDAPVMVIAAGHAAGYVLALAVQQPRLWRRIVLVAPTWRGPFPTMMGGYRPIQDRIRGALRMPVLGHALYRLNVARPMVALMYRRHVYGDAARVTPDFVAGKAAVARRPGGRFGSAAFVTGGLDVIRDRSVFLDLAQRSAVPTLLLYGPSTPTKSRAEMEALAALPDVTSQRLPAGSLAVHEEHPAQVADALLPFLHGES